MNRLLLLSVSLILLATACTSKCTIKGDANLNQWSGKNIYLKYLDENLSWVTLDSAEIVHGSFELNCPHVGKPKLVTLFMDSTPLTPLILESGCITLDLSTSDLQLQGTPLNDRLYSFYKDNQALEQKLHEQNQLSYSDPRYKSVIQAQQALIQKFMLSNRNNILGPTIVSIYYNQYPDLLNNSEIESVLSKMSNQPHTQEAELGTLARFGELEGFLYW